MGQQQREPDQQAVTEQPGMLYRDGMKPLIGTERLGRLDAASRRKRVAGIDWSKNCHAAGASSQGKGEGTYSSKDVPRRRREMQGPTGERKLHLRDPLELPATKSIGNKGGQQREPPRTRERGAGTVRGGAQ